MSNTAELVVRVSNLTHQVAEESAKGFANNCSALTLVHELKDLVDSLEHQATQEYLGSAR
ncbi:MULTISPECIES: hypothetical protein [unclassified Burkholderia]|uniref:hypothetical protein n=1 Tax=unclassified Burkholderia TaxID=2613784 RepID=UPI000F56E63F|nr:MULTISPECIES: hypothetical protein [unclassified Burkholderia]RQR87701.1 hypothetical protein DIE10_06340 [Burkholderia sp. Bp9011]RQR97046.1 hypothetical protein DIE09_06520 [Burkholderia sp. Bp9010]